MTGLGAWCRWFCCLLLAGLFTGCFLNGGNPVDEQKDPYYLTGKNRVMSKDYEGAVQSFQKALEANPRNSYAHFELALLFQRSPTNSARAIYHFEEYLRLRPKAENADVVQQFILGCKQDLARGVSLAPITQRDQLELQKYMEENVRLKHQIDDLKAQLDKRPVLPVQTQTQTVVVPVVHSNSVAVTPAARTQVVENRMNPTRAVPDPVPAPASTRTHVVKSGDSFYSISRRYGVSVSALQSANPGVDSRRLRLGQTLNIPGH